MIGFVEDLWTSIFTPGTTPTLVLATHGSFLLLTVSLTVFVFLTNFNYHLINLLILSLLLWTAITWFIAELKKEQQHETTSKETDPKSSPATTTTTPLKTKSASASTGSSAPGSVTKRTKRKV